MVKTPNIKTVLVKITDLKPSEYNPRRWSKEQAENLKESINRFGFVDPIIANFAKNRRNVVIGGHFRLAVAKQLEFTEIPVVYVNIPEIESEKELNLRLNKNQGEFDLNLLAKFDETILKNIGFSSEDLDEIFEIDIAPEQFDLEKELKKLDINKISLQKGDIVTLGSSKLMVGDSTIEADILRLMNGKKADMCFTDEPYLLDYLNGKNKHGKAVTGFGAKRDRRYLETEFLPDNFMALWMANINKIQKEDFSIISFENWKNLPKMHEEMSRYWKIRNLIVWHLPNRIQGFAAKYKFFNKFDIALLGTSPSDKSDLNMEKESELLQNEFESALFATSGKPHWESYKKGKRYCPTDFIEFNASDEKSSGQGIIFGTKPLEILIPYIKVLTQRGDLIIEPFGGSGSTLIAATKMKRRCFVMEKSPVYCEVIKKRWENLTGSKGVKI